MVVPTLPVFNVQPPLSFFQALQWLAISLVYVLLLVAGVSLAVTPLTQLVLLCHKKCKKCRCSTTRWCQPSRCHRYVKKKLLFVGRRLCVLTFPVLFKKHKTHTGRGNQMREFMVFLNRKVENNLVIVPSFCSLGFNILCTASMVFLRYFPVEDSVKCLETDRHGRSLFCYLSNSSSPVDCANYSLTELRELHFECYAVALPGLGIAVAAALGLVKVATMGVTFYIKAIESLFMLTKNQQRATGVRSIIDKRICAKNKFITIVSYALLCIVATVLSTAPAIQLYLKINSDSPLILIQKLYYVAYTLLPLLICIPLMSVIFQLSKHCDKGEYASFAADQRPPNPSDWDEESATEEQQDEASTCSSSTGENHTVLHILRNGSGEYHWTDKTHKLHIQYVLHADTSFDLQLQHDRIATHTHTDTHTHTHFSAHPLTYHVLLVY